MPHLVHLNYIYADEASSSKTPGIGSSLSPPGSIYFVPIPTSCDKVRIAIIPFEKAGIAIGTSSF
jgi:hypothetical protein